MASNQLSNFNDLKGIYEEHRSVFFKTYPKIALFDLDNTMLQGDIGDAVFSRLKQIDQVSPLSTTGEPIPISWEAYDKVLSEEGKEVAYAKAVTCMKGIPVTEIEMATRDVMASTEAYISVENKRVPIPKPDEAFLKFIQFLKQEHFRIFVISATNLFSVRIICEEWFQLEASQCFGIEPELSTVMLKNGETVKVIGEGIVPPLTISTGKAALYQRLMKAHPPLISAGDSETDLYMMNLTRSEGFSIWIGDNEPRYQNAKRRYPFPDSLYFLFRHKPSV